MRGIIAKSFASPDETRAPEKTRVEVVSLGAIEPGHDAWIVGDEPFVAYEFESQTAATFGERGR